MTTESPHVSPKQNAIPTDPVERLRFMQASLDHLTDLVIVTDAGPDPVMVYVNRAVIERTGYRREELIGRNPRLFQGAETCRATLDRIAEAIRACQPVCAELINYTRAGEPYWVDLHIMPLHDAEGRVTHFVSTQSDVTARKRTEQELLLFRQTIDQSPSSVIITDHRGRITYVNRGFETNSGYTRDEVIGRRPGFRAWQDKSRAEKRAFWDCLNSGRPWRGEFVNRSKDGRRLVKRAVVSPVLQANGEISHFLSVEQDITAEKEALAWLEYLAYHDPVTDLPNRRKLARQVGQLLVDTLEPERHALVLVDLDDFKRINDAYGQVFGDRVLRLMGQRLQSCLQEAGEVVAHLGGDEFCLLLQLPPAQGQDALAARLEQLKHSLGAPLQIDGQELSMSASLGVTWCEGAGEAFDAVHRRADLALYRAKQAGKGDHAFFVPALDAAARRRVHLEEALRLAIQRDELSIAIQSQWSPDGQLRGAEVLVRWLRGPEGGPVSPAEFIPVAEASGLIKPLTLQVLSKALDVARALRALRLEIPLSVNFSTELLRDAMLIDGVLALVQDSGVQPERLVLEITESLFIDTHADVQANMAKLLAAGLRFSLDDFGTGYSNLAYLKRMQLSELKIDKRFIDNLPEDEDNRTIVRSILSIARQLKLKVVAEGVETVSQHDFLAAHGCDLLQGYLLHRPEPAADWLRALKRQKSEKNLSKGVDQAQAAT